MSTPVRLLILEDCATDADRILSELRQAGFAPQAERVETELDYARQLDLPYNVVLSKYGLPLCETKRALQLLQARAVDIPLIVLLDQPQDQMALDLIRQGAADCVYKSQLHEIGGAVKRALEQKRLRDQKRWSDQAVRSSEKRFRTLIEYGSDGVALIDADATFIYLNPAVRKISGYSPEEAIGRHLYDFVPREDTDMVRAFIARIVQQPDSSVAYASRLKHKSGHWVRIEGCVTNLLGEPSVHAIMVTFRDVTERVVAEQQLRTRADLYQDLVDNSPMMIVTHDLEGNILSANAATLKMMARMPKDPLITNIRDLVALRFRHEVNTYLNAIEKDGVATGLMNVLTDGEERILEYVCSLRTEGVDKPIVRALLRDVTEIKQADRAHQQMTRGMTALYETLLQITQQIDLPTLLPIIVERAVNLLGRRMGALYLMRDDNQSLELVVSHELTRDFTGVVLKLGEGLSGRVAQTGQPLVVEDYAHWEGRAAVYEGIPFRRVLAVPLAIQNRVLGVLNIADDVDTQPFTEQDIRLVNLFADQTAIAVGNARLLAEAKRRADELATLHETTNDLATQHELPGLLQMIVERAVRLMGATSGRILLYDPVRHDLEVAAAIHSNMPVGARMRLGEGAAGRVALTRQPLVINDYSTWEGRVPYYSEASLHAAIGIPMEYGGELIGVLTVTETRSTMRTFGDRDARLLSLFATQAASAVHNARLFEQTKTRAEQLGLLYDAGLTLNRMLDPHAVVNFLMTIAAKTVKAERVDFFRFDPDSQTLYFESGSGYMHDQAISRLGTSPMPLGSDRGLVGRVAADRVPLYLPDVHADPRWIAFDPNIRSALLAPVVREDELRGVVTVSSTREDAFSPSDQRLVSLFANQLSSAMENARLFNETRRRADQLAIVNRIASAVNRTIVENALLELIHQELSAILRFDAFYVALYDANTDELDFRIQIDQGTREPPQRVARQSAAYTSLVIETRKPILIRNWEQEKDRFPMPTLFGTMAIPNSFLGIPLSVGNAVIGVIAVQAYAPNAYNNDDEQLLATIGDQIAVAIEKARLFEEERMHRQELTALYDLSRALSMEQEQDSILNLVVRHSVHALGVSFARVALVEEDQVIVRAGYPTHVLNHDHQLGRQELLAAHPTCQKVIASDTPVVIGSDDSSLTDQERSFCFLGVAQYICIVPLRAGGRTLGVLMLGQTGQDNSEPFPREKLHLANSIVDQAASALARAELQEQTNRSALDLASAYDATIEGWARALEMKDQEAQGHTRRVTELALYLARALNIPEPDLTHIRRGALLHDIGKMAIPDAILFKTASLSPEEVKTLQQHPANAHALLYPIAYLRPALDIPYCHHEKWDGTGYPRGLKGEEIPLAARIFALADVWDAMLSKRSYRPAWDEKTAREYIEAQAGKHFDPKVVKLFLDPRTFAFYRTLGYNRTGNEGGGTD